MVDRTEQPPADEPVTETDRDQHPTDTASRVHLRSRLRRRPVLRSLAGTGLAAIAGVAPVAASETASDQTETGSDTDGDTGTDATAEPELVADLEPPALPENLALDDSGTVYLSLAVTGELLAVDPDGNQESVAQFDVGEEGALLGIVAVDGTIYALVNSGESETHGVWTVDIASGDTERMAALPAETAPNGITIDPYTEDGFLVTDHLGGAIWRVTPDDATVWVDDEVLDPDPEAEAGVGADGIAINPDGDVYVDNLDYGRLVRVPVSEDGSPGELDLVAEEDSLVGADGMTFDSQGRLYVAVNARDAIVRVELGSEMDDSESIATEDGGSMETDDNESMAG
ncbi:SMP-30/gluconolactonase/LRE family protein, partial [Natrialba aegyptia]